MADSVFIIDSTFLLETGRNSFHGAPLLQDSSDRDSTMLFGFVRDLLRLRKQLGIRKALVVIGDDGPCPPDSLVSEATDFLKRLRVTVIHVKGVRVGDVCAALADRCNWIVTGNQAMLQIASDRCGVILPKKGNELHVVTCGLWLANCYFAHDSSGFPSLLRFCHGQSARSFHNRAPVL